MKKLFVILLLSLFYLSVMGCKNVDTITPAQTINKEISIKVINSRSFERSLDWAIIETFEENGFEKEISSYPMKFVKKIKKENINFTYEVNFLSPLITEDKIYITIVYVINFNDGSLPTLLSYNFNNWNFSFEKELNGMIDLIEKKTKEDNLK